MKGVFSVICSCCGKEIPDGEKKCVFCRAEIAEQTDVKQESAKRVTAVPESRITCPMCGSHNVRIEMVPNRIVSMPVFEVLKFRWFVLIAVAAAFVLLFWFELSPPVGWFVSSIFAVIVYRIHIFNKNNTEIRCERICVCQVCGQHVILDDEKDEKDGKKRK